MTVDAQSFAEATALAAGDDGATLEVPLAISPSGGVVHAGGITGPFSAPSTVYALTNKSQLSSA